MKLSRGEPLVSDTSTLSDRSLSVLASFDMTPARLDELVSFRPFDRPPLPETWGIGLIVGASGSGKSLLLRQFGVEQRLRWDDRAIIDHFDNPDVLAAVGLNDVPTWCRPYQALSTGQRFRADLARRLRSGAVVDEYTSVVSRSVAMSASRALRRYVDHTGLTNLALATCHHDVEQWLVPDWVIDTDDGVLRDTKYIRRTWETHVLPPTAAIVLNRRRIIRP